MFAGSTVRRPAPGAPGAPAAQRGLSLRARLLLAATVIPVILACGWVRPVTTLTAAPAARLSLLIWINYDRASATSVPFTINVITSAPVSGGEGEVVFAGHLRLTVNGVRVPEPTPSNSGNPARRMTVPRQPPGGSYHVVYTDERGQQTTVMIPAPLRDPTITSPAVGALVPIPRPSTPPGGSSGTATSGPGTVVPVPLAELRVTYTPIAFPPESVPSGPDEYGYQSSAYAWGTCTQSTRNLCGPCNGHMSLCRIASTGVLAASQELYIDVDAGVGFEHMAPGSGEIEVDTQSFWKIPQSGFAEVGVTVNDSAYSPITWVAQ